MSAQEIDQLNRLLTEHPDRPTRVLPRGAVVDGFVLTGTAAEEPEYVLYLASLGRFGAPAMLKLFDPSPLHDAAYYRRLKRSARRWKRVSHPNLVPLAAARKSAHGPYLATAPYAGPTLAKVLGDGALRPAAAAAIVADVASALDALLEEGLVTGEVSPADIVLTKEGTLVTDPGVGRARSGSGLAESPRTAEYLSPEVAGGDSPVPQSTVYSLACVLHACLTGEPPYTSDLPHAVVYAQLSEPPPRPSERQLNLPRELDLVFQRAMAADAAHRYATPGELAQAAAVALGLRASEVSPPVSEKVVPVEIPVPAAQGNENGNGNGKPLAATGGAGGGAAKIQDAEVVSPVARVLSGIAAAGSRTSALLERAWKPLAVAGALAACAAVGALAGSAGSDSTPEPAPPPARAPVDTSANTSVLSALETDRATLRGRLARADTRGDQARAASSLAAAHRRAERGLAGPGATAAREALAVSAAAYADLARAARGGEGSAWNQARARARQADSQLTQALRPAP